MSGVFEVEDIAEVLTKNNAKDIFVVRVPANVRYVDYMVIASGKSEKHLLSISDFVHKLFKKKRSPTDSVPKFLNKKPLDWIAVDLGQSRFTLNYCYFHYNNNIIFLGIYKTALRRYTCI